LWLCFPGPWHRNDPKIFFHEIGLACSSSSSSSVYRDAPLVGVARKKLATCPKFNRTSIVGPLGVMSVVLAAATFLVEQDIDGRPLGGAVESSASGHH
jgi:hypothetical protein